MKAAIINKWGSPEVFEITDIDVPKPKSDQVLIKVFSSSINPVDWKHRIGFHKYVLGAPFPIILGYDVCGEVMEIGTEVRAFNIGDIVFGDLDNKYGGGLAEYALGHEHCFALKPSNISINDAAALPLASLTALQALRDKANLKAGQTVIINGASGGVGHFAIQIAKIMGARVIAIASGANKDFLDGFMPDKFVDYNVEDIRSIHEKVDVFFDVHGNYSFLKTKNILKSNGIYINTHPRIKILFHKLFQAFSNGKKVKTLLRKHSAKDMQQIAKWISENKLTTHIDKSFPLEKIASAHAYAEKGHTKGKNIILIA